MSSSVIKILLIDDEPEILCALKAVLETQGWEGLMAQNVRQALELYEKSAPDLILIDYHMPHINGVEGVKMFRKIDPDIPIIVFTIDEDQSIADKFLEAGASDFATKPIKAPDIISRIRVHIRLMESKKAKKNEYEPFIVKGIGTSTMELIKDAMRGQTQYLTVEEISEKTGLAYQTTYRYLQHLTSEEKVDVKSSYGKKGRPKQSYLLL